jgi:hypothetical protein
MSLAIGGDMALTDSFARPTAFAGLTLVAAVAAAVTFAACSQGELGGDGTFVSGTGGGDATPTNHGTGGDPGLTSSSSGMADPHCAQNSPDQVGCACEPGSAPRDCYDGDPAQAGVGACAKGKQECVTIDENEFMGGIWQPCIGSGKPGTEVCEGKNDEDCDGKVDNGCNCIEGATQDCVLPTGTGSQTCTNNMWTECLGNTCGGAIVQGAPCNTPGTAIPTPPNSCGCGSYGQYGSGDVIYCDDQGTWQCFPADDCTPAACKACLDQHCAAEQVDADPTCNSQLQIATKWLEQCGPDRDQWFNNLNQGCPSQNVTTLNQCKFQFCIMNGTCSFW